MTMPRQAKAKLSPEEQDRALLQAVRQRHALSQWLLGRLIGVHCVTVSRWESRGGLSDWQRAVLAKLLEARPQALPADPVEAFAVLLSSGFGLDRPRPAPAPLPPPRRPLALPPPEPDPKPNPTRFLNLEID